MTNDSASFYSIKIDSKDGGQVIFKFHYRLKSILFLVQCCQKIGLKNKQQVVKSLCRDVYWVDYIIFDAIINFITKRVQQMGCGVSQESIKAVSLPSNDRYERRELIGVGHHGRVYKSFYELDKKQYANKVIDQFRPNTNLQKVLAESCELINRLKKLRNDKIATYYQIDFNEKEVSIIMELSKEGTLKKYIQKNGAQSEEIASNFAESVLLGLNYLHNAGVLHKDLKTTNVLMMPKDELQLSDFGIAEIYDERLAQVKGKGQIKNQIDYYRGDSLPYMAPQVIKNIEIIDKSDVWSVGCIVIQILTGKIPWIDLADNFEKIFKIISNGALPPLPKNLTKQCSSFLEACLAVIPTQRSSVKDLLGHKFIRKYSKNSSVFFGQTSLDNIKVTLENSDKMNRMQQKPQKNAKVQNFLNDSIQLRKSTTQNELIFAVPRDRQSRISRRNRISRQIDQNVLKIKEALQSMQPKKQRQSPYQEKEDKKQPASQQQPHTVILNNKKIQLDPARYRSNQNPNAKRMRTQENEWNSPPRNKSRAKHSIQVEKIALDSTSQYYDPFKHHSSNFEDSLDTEIRVNNLRLETQPNSSEYSDRQYFKRPLKLLKKKLKESKESKESSDFSKKLSNQASKAVMKNDLLQLHEEQLEEDLTLSRKARAYTQTKREERVIDTQLARAERDRFITQQKLMKKLRQEQKFKWEQELKKGGEIIKKQLKYYYYNPNPLISS